MRHPPLSIMLAAGLSLVALQLSGLHMDVDAHGYAGAPQGKHVHVAAHGYVGAPQGTHVHGQGVVDHGTVTNPVGAEDRHDQTGGQDHEGDKDMSVVEFSTGVSKLLVFLVWLGLGLFTVLRPATQILPIAAVPRPVVRNMRWRPPLRAPPQFSYSPSH